MRPLYFDLLLSMLSDMLSVMTLAWMQFCYDIGLATGAFWTSLYGDKE
jgi:hypothetical protein